ncbi:MAG TPA: protease modulator HflC, partial [Clostridia bacterium]|nr:protease modulator HflC [Clostridia bacterium]
MKHLWKWIFAMLLALIIGIYGFTFTVRQGRGAIVSRFGQIRRICSDSGLFFKLPYPFDNVIPLDLRAQVMDSGNTETLTRDKRNIIMQTYLVWNIEDLSLFYTSIGNMDTASKYLNDLLANGKNSVMGGYDLSALVSTDLTLIELDDIEKGILAAVAGKARDNYGIHVSSVQVKRLAFPYTNVESVFEQMSTDRQRYVTQLLSEGQRDAAIIKSQADTDAAQIIADGQTQAASIKAETERLVAAVYAEAYEENPEL